MVPVALQMVSFNYKGFTCDAHKPKIEYIVEYMHDTRVEPQYDQLQGISQAQDQLVAATNSAELYS